jgi:hypothetical protein
MGDITVWLDDELEKRAAAVGIDTADVAAQAVAQAVAQCEAYAEATADIRRVAERIAATDPNESRRLAAYRDGANWARETASITQLRQLADTEDPTLYLPPTPTGMDPEAHAEEFTHGALDVYEQVEPLLG